MSTRNPFIFVIIPFDLQFEQIYQNIETLAKLFAASAKRADAADREAKQISDQIIRLTRKADLIVADITQPNPNIYYEIGYAHSLGKPVFMIARDLKEVAFDIRNYHIVTYGDNTNIRDFSKIVQTPFAQALDGALQGSSLRLPIMETLDFIDSMGTPHDDLFCSVMRHYLDQMKESAHQWSSGRVYVDRVEAIKKGIEIFRGLRQGGFVTFLIRINEFWNSTDTYAQECRDAARKPHVLIERVFISPDFDSLFHSQLRERIDLDERSGIRTYIALSRAIEQEAVHDFGIWDDQVLCLIDTNPVKPTEVSGATFSRSPSELSSAREWKNKIRSKSVPAPVFLQHMDELGRTNEHLALLLRSADYMADQARNLCHGSYLGKDDCRWYHQAWQYLRILDMVSTPDRHADFYFASLQQTLLADDAVQVLISGTADYGILQQIVAATPSEKMRSLIVNVLDVCRTPLQICDWLARLHKKPGQAMPRLIPLEEDMLNTKFADNSVDVIVTDAFLTRFTNEEKVRIVAEWSRILRPQGRVITTARIANGAVPNSNGLITSSQQDVQDFALRAVDEARRVGNWFPIALSELYSLARGYAERISSAPFAGVDALRSLFMSQNFQLDDFQTQFVKGEFHPTTLYGRVIARKVTR